MLINSHLCSCSKLNGINETDVNFYESLLKQGANCSCCVAVLGFSDQDDYFNSCAVQVHRTCSKKFLDLMKENQRICRDSVEWFACYKTKASEINCNSPIIKQYSNFVEKVGIQLVSDALFANSCNAEL